jgi:D-alanine-D-alanine ligase
MIGFEMINREATYMQNIAIVYGGQSSEHETARKSFGYLYSRLQAKALRDDLKVTHIMYITKNGQTIVSAYDSTKSAVDYEQGEKIALIDAFKFIIDNNLFAYGVLFGQNGEDGRAQGMADFFSLETSFGGIISCALGMSKYHLNQYVRVNFPQIKVPKTIAVTTTDSLDDALAELKGKEIVVKPNSLGSSVMTEKFRYTDDEFPKIRKLIGSILNYDVRALVQEYVKGTEYSCSTLEYEGAVLPLSAVKIETANNFYGQKEKFLKGQSSTIVVHEEDDSPLLSHAKQAGAAIFKDLDFRNAARFDFILTENDVYFLEANPMPGILQGSILTKALRVNGWDVEKLIEIAVDNEHSQKAKATEYQYVID